MEDESRKQQTLYAMLSRLYGCTEADAPGLVDDHLAGAYPQGDLHVREFCRMVVLHSYRVYKSYPGAESVGAAKFAEMTCRLVYHNLSLMS